ASFKSSITITGMTGLNVKISLIFIVYNYPLLGSKIRYFY
ncbi:MAG: hypothetical protein ACI9IA_000965, partial [Enterobacterales bacterium]